MSKLTLSPVIKGRENKRSDWASKPVMSQKQAMICTYAKCRKIFSEPIKLTVRGKGSLETYYACPHCLSQVSVSDKPKKDLSEVSFFASKDTSKNIKHDDAMSCDHFLGYLKTRPKDSPIPDACLTCNRILKCM